MDKAEKEKKLKILLPILIIVSAMIWIPNFKQDPKGVDEEDNTSTEIGAVVPADMLAILAGGSQNTHKQISRYDDWGRNPFVEKDWTRTSSGVVRGEIKPAQSAEKIEGLVLNGVFWNKRKPSALINDEVIGVGMSIAELTVIAITKEKVLLSDGTKNFELSVKQ